MSSPKKRGDFFGKIAHTAEKYIDSRLVVKKSEWPIPVEILAQYFHGDCFVVAEHSAPDGKTASFKDAVNELWSCGVSYLIYAGEYLYLETEYDFSTHASYLLKRSVQ